ncbi:MAG: response regulator [Rhodospirillaceae bacterium]|nr:response regulator [Rhodospirillaceae bacterium]
MLHHGRPPSLDDAPGAPAPSEGNEAAQGRPRVLVVEDQALIALALSADLTALGCDVVGRTARGEDAVAMALRERPDLVMMDVHLAGAMSGIEAAARIRAESTAQIVFLTAFGDGPNRVRMEAQAPMAILGKPYEMEVLADIANEIRGWKAWASAPFVPAMG